MHATVNRVFNSPQYANVKNYNDSIEMIYNAVNNSYTDYHWLMTVKQARPKTESSSKTYYYNCKDCFTILDPKG